MLIQHRRRGMFKVCLGKMKGGNVCVSNIAAGSIQPPRCYLETALLLSIHGVQAIDGRGCYSKPQGKRREKLSQIL
jgi:hypothetical protein